MAAAIDEAESVIPVLADAGSGEDGAGDTTDEADDDEEDSSSTEDENDALPSLFLDEKLRPLLVPGDRYWVALHSGDLL